MSANPLAKLKAVIPLSTNPRHSIPHIRYAGSCTRTVGLQERCEAAATARLRGKAKDGFQDTGEPQGTFIWLRRCDRSCLDPSQRSPKISGFLKTRRSLSSRLSIERDRSKASIFWRARVLFLSLKWA
jgi:hypothetical protein